LENLNYSKVINKSRENIKENIKIAASIRTDLEVCTNWSSIN